MRAAQPFFSAPCGRRLKLIAIAWERRPRGGEYRAINSSRRQTRKLNEHLHREPCTFSSEEASMWHVATVVKCGYRRPEYRAYTTGD